MRRTRQRSGSMSRSASPTGAPTSCTCARPASGMPSVYLLRHGEADYSLIRDRNWPGATADLAPLTVRGTRQAAQAAQRLSAVGVTQIVSSPMTRALQTAAILAG